MYFCLYISWLSDLPNRLMSHKRSPDDHFFDWNNFVCISVQRNPWPSCLFCRVVCMCWYRFVVGLFLNAQVFFIPMIPCFCLCNGLCAPIEKWHIKEHMKKCFPTDQEDVGKHGAHQEQNWTVKPCAFKFNTLLYSCAAWAKYGRLVFTG